MAFDLPVGAWADEIRRALDARDVALLGWAPPMDVLESPDHIEVRLDVPGIPLDALTVSVRDGSLTVAGDKPHACRGGSTFHVAERGCGRFARAIPLAIAFDASRITATLTHGELRIVVPRIEERRGRAIVIPVIAS